MAPLSPQGSPTHSRPSTPIERVSPVPPNSLPTFNLPKNPTDRTNTVSSQVSTEDGQGSEDVELQFTRDMKNVRRHLREIKELLSNPTRKIIEQVLKKVDLVYAKAEACKSTHFALCEKLRAVDKEQVGFLRDVVSNLATKSDVVEAIANRAEAGNSIVEGSTEIISKIAEKSRQHKRSRHLGGECSSSPSSGNTTRPTTMATLQRHCEDLCTKAHSPERSGRAGAKGPQRSRCRVTCGHSRAGLPNTQCDGNRLQGHRVHGTCQEVPSTKPETQ